MPSRIIRTSHDIIVAQSGRAKAWVGIARNVVLTAHSAFALVGLIAISALVTLYFKPDAIGAVKGFPVFSKAVSRDADAPVPQSLSFLDKYELQREAKSPENPEAKAETETAAVNPRQQQRVASWISKRYRIAGDATNLLVSAAYLTAQETKLDPLLILAVVAIESGFNPIAESAAGAQGLMQVMSKLHKEKFDDHGGVTAALNPIANIKVGSLILRDYVARAGSLEAGLKLYVGAATQESDSGYGARVIAEYNRLKQVALGKQVPAMMTTAAAPSRKAVPAEAPPSVQKPEANDEAESAGQIPKLLPKRASDRIALL